MTRLEFKFLKVLLYLVAGLLGLLLGFIPARAQAPEPVDSLVPMVRNMPFPYAQGFAIRQSYLDKLRLQLAKADVLREKSQRAIDALSKTIQSAVAYQHQLDSLGTYNRRAADSLQVVVTEKQGLLTQAQDSLGAANRARDRILAPLPKRIRKILATATPDQQATAVTEHVTTLVWRKWKWLGAGTGIGFVLSIVAAALR